MVKIMGIINVTPDSFWSGSRVQDKTTLLERVRFMISHGAEAIDVGGCSTRPGAVQASADEEMQRLEWGLEVIRAEFPDILLSVDTYRPQIAERCVKEWKVGIINDVYGGNDDMYKVVADTGAQYVLMWSETIKEDPVGEMMSFFIRDTDSERPCSRTTPYLPISAGCVNWDCRYCRPFHANQWRGNCLGSLLSRRFRLPS